MISKKSLFSSLRSVFLCPKITLPFANETVFVANLSFKTDWAELKDYFRQAGNVTFTKILTTPEGRSKGVGFVTFEEESQAKKAIELLNEQNWNGRVIRVSQADNRDNKTNNRPPQRTPRRDYQDHREEEDNEVSYRENREKSSSQLESDYSGNSNKINVSVDHLNQENAWKSVQDAFNNCGDVLKVNINNEDNENIYVVFEKEKSIEKAMKIIKSISIDGKKINLESKNN